MTDRNTMDDVVEIIARAIFASCGHDTMPEDKRQDAEDIIQALSEAGLVLAPREATEEMKRAAAGHGLAFPDEAGEIWSAMIAASSKGEE